MKNKTKKANMLDKIVKLLNKNMIVKKEKIAAAIKTVVNLLLIMKSKIRI